MPTISTESIEGFAEMTPEQKVEALLKVEVPEKVDLSGYIQKSQFDKVSSELAEAKKAAKAKMTEEEAAAAEREAKWAEMEAKVQKLEREKIESTYKASYLTMPGFDEKLAEEAAKAMADGNMEKVFELQKKANEAAEKEIRAKIMKGNPGPNSAGSGKADEDDEAVEFAKRLGKQRSEALKLANDGLKHYL